MNVPMLDLAAEYRDLEVELAAAAGKVIASGRFILGPEGEALEQEVAAYLGVKHAVAVASGTDALHLALRAAGIGPGDEVITPSFTFIAAAEAVSYVGARVVFVDIDPATYNLDPSACEAAISPATRAVIAVHLFGQTADLPAIDAICKRRGLTLIEDCAQAIGADFDGRRAGAWGALGCFSFYPTKNLGAYGDAGMVVTDDPKLAEVVRMLRHHGSRITYRHEMIGYNSRLDELQAAILRVKLKHLDRWNALRRERAGLYRRLLAGSPVGLPVEHGRGAHVYHQFTIRAPLRDALREQLAARGVASAIYYPVPVHQQPVYAREYGSVTLPVSERAAREVLSLPIYPQLTESAVKDVCDALREAAASAKPLRGKT
ncbi:MAG TPA: DegT/DnrJ/EryC1/StrS family aminotransferase [Burkholderiales bacterium]|nr:DegT/DnrJ/EryC1/StrS family aminotransferase [Burkholderiales bacterium]